MTDKETQTAEAAHDEKDDLEQDVERIGLIQEFVAYLGENKKWWMIPIVVMFVLLSLLFVLGGSAAAPFIYTLF